MEPARRGGAARPVIAAALLLVALASLGLWRVLDGSEDLPFADSATPPNSVQVTLDHTYSLAVPGGVRAMLAHGVPAASSSAGQLISLQCTWTSPGRAGGGQALAVSAENVGTKAENTVGQFVAPIGGAIHVDCDGWGAMFIPDSDDRPLDLAGWALLVAVLSLSVGAALGLSELRRAWQRSHESRPAGDDDEVERFVDITPFVGGDREILGGDRGDVGP
jgi:hypothetical protein